MKHSDTLNLLYDYIADELNAADKAKVEQHLSTCSGCSNELQALQHTITLLAHATSESPSDARDSAFWTSLARGVMTEIQQNKRRKASRVEGVLDKIKMFFSFRPGFAYAMVGGAVAVLLAVVLFRWSVPAPEQFVTDQAQTDSSFVFENARNRERIEQYFRKSKTLLIGIANLKTDRQNDLDLSLERKVSRDLIRETRFIKYQPINNRTEKLVRDLEKILIELANTEEATDLPNVELIRSGIHQENLLFKIRMAEASFESAERQRIY